MDQFTQLLESRRLFNAGGLDITYGTGGIGSAPLAGDGVTTVAAMQSGDRMLVGGATTTGSVTTPYLKRFNSEGKLDTNFAGTALVAGKVRALDSIDAMATLPNGDILIAGKYAGLQPSMELMRLTPSGKLDTTFGKNGVAKLSIGLANISVGADGKIVLAGGGSSIIVARFNANGSLDKTFGTNGIADTRFGLTDKDDPDAEVTFNRNVTFVSETAGGRVILGGTYSFREDGDGNVTDNPFVAQLSAQGTVDNPGGSRLFSDISGRAQGFAIAADGSILVAAGNEPVPGSASTPEKLYKFDAHASHETVLATLDANVTNILQQSNGQILVESATGLKRYNVNGQEDPLFTAKNLPANDRLVDFGSDGSIFTFGLESTKVGKDSFTFTAHPTRRWREEGPAGLLFVGDLTAPSSKPFRFSIQWRDDDGVSVKSLATSSIRVVGPDGTTYKATFLGTTKAGNGIERTANYKVAAPGGTWDAADNGAYTVRLLDGAVKDILGAIASKRALGLFNVSIT